MTPTVAISSDFLEAFARLPRSQQRRVTEFTEKFQSNPKSPGINYEKIRGAQDDKFRTVRIDRQYRAVVLHPSRGDVYVLLWVGNHDEAIDWARRRRIEVHPRIGALQLINVAEAEQAVRAEVRPGGRDLFADYSDEDLVSLGLPVVLLPAVRAVRKQEDLTHLCPHLPAEASEALLYLADGIPLEEVRRAVGSRTERTVDTTDLVKALANPDTKRRFVTVQSDADLDAMLEAPLAKWRVFLHPSQDKLVKKWFNGPAQVLGGAGTGKTVVAMHRIKYLAEEVYRGSGDRLLFTTYTANLAENVREMLETLCPQYLDRIDVIHLHAWAVQFLRSEGITVTVADADQIDRCWQQAIGADSGGYDISFLRQEWEQVVQAQGIEKEAQYLEASRLGRDKLLSRSQRIQVWAIFRRYRRCLKAENLCEWVDVIRQARRLLEQKKRPAPYRTVVVDEAQDFRTEDWKLIRALVPPGPNDLFLVGDAYQRIYGRKVVLRDCGVNVTGRSSTLKINYRTTEQIRAWATALLDGKVADDLNGGTTDTRGYRSLLSGPKPEYHHFATAAEEQQFLVRRLREWLDERPAEEICLVARSTKLVKDYYQQLLKEEGIPHTVLGKSREASGTGVRLATVHRVKGLEFPVMIVGGVNAGEWPRPIPSSLQNDPTALAEHLEQERSLLYVAATRARDRLLVTSWGEPSPLFAELAPAQPVTVTTG